MENTHLSLGEVIRQRRTACRLSRTGLARLCGISHTEICRIESGEREVPSLRHLYALADALQLSREQLLNMVQPGGNEALSPLQRAFPALRREKEREVVERIADGLSRSRHLQDEDLEELYRQVDMFLRYKEKA